MKTTLLHRAFCFAAVLITSLPCFADDPAKIQKIKAADLTEEHGAKAQAPDQVKSGQNYTLYLEFKDAQTAKDNQLNYKLLKGDQQVDAKLNDKTLYFELTDPLKGLDPPKVLLKVLYFKDPKNKPKESVTQYQYELDLDDGKKTDAGAKVPKVDYIALAKDQKFKVDLDEFKLDNSCCPDDDYPCLTMSVYDEVNKFYQTVPDKGKTLEDLKNEQSDLLTKTPRNWLIYDAKHNDIYWFDKTGKPKALSQEDHKFFSVTAGDGITFEIINVNPDAYKLSLDQTSVSTYQDANAMLAKFLVPFKAADGTGAAVGQEGTPTPPKRIDLVRAGLITVDATLNDFLLRMAATCDNLNFKLISYKAAAKAKVDAFLTTSLNKPTSQSLDQFMRSELEISKDDSTLYKVTTSLYNALIVAPNHSVIATHAKYNRDRIDFKYSILAKDKTPYINKAKDEIIPIYITGNFKVDVSTGLYYALKMRNDQFTLHADSDVTSAKTTKGMRLIDDQKNYGEFGFSSYLHFYRIHSPNFSWGGHIGVGLSLDDQVKPRYFTGLSFLFGRESGRIGLNLGVAMGNVDRISNQYTQGGTSTLSAYTLQPSTVTSVTYISHFDLRPVIGISYNLPFLLSKPAQTATAGK